MDGPSSGGTFDQYLYAIELDTADRTLYCAGATNKEIPTNAPPYNADGYDNTMTNLNGGSNTNYWTTIVYRINFDGTDLMDLTSMDPLQ